jgi:hypothetical protein
MFYEVFVSYNIPYTTKLHHLKEMTWPVFLKLCYDVGYEDKDEFLAYYFYISSSISKELSPKV